MRRTAFAICPSMCVALYFLVGACAVDSLAIDGKSCPCLDTGGWLCDEATNQCVQTIPTEELGEVKVSNLAAEWTTSNSIRWTWDPDGEADKLSRYELHVGLSEADLLAETNIAVWGEEQNPELGRYLFPRTFGEDVVRFTVTDLHDPGQLYYAQLVAYDTSNRVAKSNVAVARTTLSPQNEVVIFTDAETMGFSIPSSFTFSSDHYEFISICADGSATCYENLRRQNIAIDVDGMTAGPLSTTAFWEFKVSTDSPDPSYWSAGRLRFNECQSCVYRYEALTLRADGEYRTIQLPLRVMTEGESTPGVRISPTIDTVNSGLYEFTIGGNWGDGALVRIDEMKIRW